MYFWRIRELVALLSRRDLTESEAFRYYFASSMLFVVALEFSLAIPMTHWNVWDTSGAIATMLIAASGMIWCFMNNGGANGRSFLQRMFSLSWVVTIRFIVLLVAVLVVSAPISLALGGFGDATTWWDFLVASAFEAAIFIRVAVHLKTLRSATERPLPEIT